MSIIHSREYDPYYYNDHHFGGTYAAPHPTNFSYEITSTPLVGSNIQWKETPEAHVFKVELPGLTKDEVKVELEESNVLCISGEKIIEKEERSDHWYHVARSGGKFVRSFKLPDNAKAKDLKACMENGVLIITVPKKEIKKTCKTIHIY